MVISRRTRFPHKERSLSMEVRQFNLNQAKNHPSLHLKDGSSGNITPEPTISELVGEELQLQRITVNQHNQQKRPAGLQLQLLLSRLDQVRATPY